jgi:hypothetical protein
MVPKRRMTLNIPTNFIELSSSWEAADYIATENDVETSGDFKQAD